MSGGEATSVSHESVVNSGFVSASTPGPTPEPVAGTVEPPAAGPSMDRGLTHVALTVDDVDRSIEFYRDYAGFEVVHRRTDPTSARSVAWISDLTRPFVIVLIEAESPSHPLGGFNHLGVGVGRREEVDRLVAKALAEGRPVLGPLDYGYPVGYWAFIQDPDGHNLELAFGQEVGLVVDQHRRDTGGARGDDADLSSR